MPEDPQHYIGVGSFGRVHVAFGPEALAELAEMGTEPPEPLIIEGVTLYPVSAEVASEWSLDRHIDLN